MNITIRRSELKDLDLLEQIDQNAFPLYQQSSRRTLKRSLESNFQQAWIACINAEEKRFPVGILILYLYEQSVRIFSIAVLR